MDWVTLALTFGSKLLDVIPNRDELKQARLKKLINQYKAETTKKISERDDDRILNLREEIYTFLETIAKDDK